MKKYKTAGWTKSVEITKQVIQNLQKLADF